MANYRGTYDTFNASNLWSYCHDCGKGIRHSDKAAHMKKHLSRPHEDALTPDEVEEILGMTQGELNNIIRAKRIDVIRNPGKKRIWIMRESVVAYAKTRMEAGDLRMMQIVTSGGKKKHG